MRWKLSSYRSVARGWVRAAQETVWTKRPLTPQSVEKILRGWDRHVKVVQYFPSESHQVFQVTFRGQGCVAKFAGQSFHWKFVLQEEVARMKSLAEAALQVPKIILGEEKRWRNPFFITPYLSTQLRALWTDEIHRASWVKEAAIARSLSGIVKSKQLPVKSLAHSVRDLELEIAAVKTALARVGLSSAAYLGPLERFEAGICSRPWDIGQLQPPELVYDGTQFWAIDWDAFSYTHPLKWVNDYSFYDHVRNPILGKQHLTYLLSALGFDPADPATQAEVRRWQQFKAMAVGTYLIEKSQRWSYFETLKQRFFD